ncbi:hypothetical protein VNI00_008799 [Paramarasmius palmivorus]|uniref:Nephrocystin 3-like N-terminal domain-containing protein n=1 Tax=Paramarasmius palmivorus TaxID=297713 RepID=A0AAW0CW44_9AGAR
MVFNNPKDFSIHGGAHNTVYGPQYNATYQHDHGTTDDTPQILHRLAERAAMNACHDAEARYPPPNCHPNTRVEILNRLGRWMDDEHGAIRVSWIHGAAGVGKSAIAQKFSENHPDRLIGTFFFSRDDSTRNNLDRFVATIVYQCCVGEPFKDTVRPLIIEIIRSNPNIFRTTSETQFRKLILEPLSSLTPGQRQTLPNLIVIDGLDECIDPSSQARLLGIIDLAITFVAPNPFPFIFLLCSRPEPQISHYISTANFRLCLERIEIAGIIAQSSGSPSESELDILKYFSEKFTELRGKYRYVLSRESEMWPSEAEMRDLISRARGQFIFATTVIKFIDSPDERPQDRLRAVLSTDPREIQSSPFPALDMLYRQILATCGSWDDVSPILRLLVSPPPVIDDADSDDIPDSDFWHAPTIITGLLQLKQGEVETLLSKLHPVIHVPTDRMRPTFSIHHATFTEFLLDDLRSGDYCIIPYFPEEYCDLITVFLLHTISSYTVSYPLYRSPGSSFGAALSKWKTLIESDRTDDSRKWRSKLQIWVHFCIRVEIPSPSLLVELNEVDPYSMVHGLMRGDSWFHSFNYTRVLKWAKELGDMTPQIFIDRMETFLRGFYIGYRTAVSRSLAVAVTFGIDCIITDLPEAGMEYIHNIIMKYYRRWWHEWEDPVDLDVSDSDVLVLPFTTDSRMALPTDWVVVPILKSNGEVLKRVHYDVYFYLDKKARREFHKDVVFDTSESVTRKLVKEGDLSAFKALLYERRSLFENLATPQSTSARLGSAWRWLKHRAIESDFESDDSN